MTVDIEESNQKEILVYVRRKHRRQENELSKDHVNTGTTSNTLTDERGGQVRGPRKRFFNDAAVSVGNKKHIVIEENSSSVLYHCKLCNKVAVNEARWLQHVSCARHKKEVKSKVQEDFRDYSVRPIKATADERSFWRLSDT